jgi:exodeoxyribonuclease V alpha subunit
VRIFKTYGADAIQVMTENPYRLARDIRGIGFKTADAIAMKLGIEKAAMVRVRAGISYALTEAMDEGHCGLPTEELIPLAEKLLEVPQELIRTALDLELQEGTVIADQVGETPCVFLAGLHRAERKDQTDCLHAPSARMLPSVIGGPAGCPASSLARDAQTPAL